MNPPLIQGALENCALDERKTLQDGTTKAIPYPKAGFNCNPYGIAAQQAHGISYAETAGPNCNGDEFSTTLFAQSSKSCLNAPLKADLSACPGDGSKTLA
jgi:hypothetical protein